MKEYGESLLPAYVYRKFERTFESDACEHGDNVSLLVQEEAQRSPSLKKGVSFFETKDVLPFIESLKEIGEEGGLKSESPLHPQQIMKLCDDIDYALYGELDETFQKIALDKRIGLVNLSLTLEGYFLTSGTSEPRKFLQAGKIFVCALGNDHREVGSDFLFLDSNAYEKNLRIFVGALGRQGKMADYSNYPDHHLSPYTIFADGEFDSPTDGFMQGTSFAAPRVTGMLSHAMRTKNLTGEEARYLLFKTAKERAFATPSGNRLVNVVNKRRFFLAADFFNTTLRNLFNQGVDLRAQSKKSDCELVLKLIGGAVREGFGNKKILSIATEIQNMFFSCPEILPITKGEFDSLRYFLQYKEQYLEHKQEYLNAGIDLSSRRILCSAIIEGFCKIYKVL